MPSGSTLARLLAPASGEPVEADASRQLGDPGAERLRVAQRSEPVVDPQEDVLEGVLGVGALEAVALRGDRVDVARVLADEVVPRVLVACQAACDEFGVLGHRAVKTGQAPASRARPAE